MRAQSPRSSYPSLLGAQVGHAHRFARTLGALYDDAGPEDASLLWLTGRADEVLAFVDEVLREWAQGAVDATSATIAIEEYLAGLHAAMEPWFGTWYAPTCCGPSCSRVRESGFKSRPRLRRVDALTDTVIDGAPPLALSLLA
jgi:hypothetical protein